MTGDLIIRDFQDADAKAFFTLWRIGFFEMKDDGLARGRQHLFFFVVVAFLLALFLRFLVCPLVFFLGFAFQPDGLWLSVGCFLVALIWELVVDRLGWPKPVGERWQAALARLHSAVFWQIIPLAGREMKSATGIRSTWVVPNHSHVWVAESAEGELLGAVACRLTHALAKMSLRADVGSTEASVWRLVVAPNARRLGLGRKLMAAAEEWAREKGASHMSLVTGTLASKRFYLNIGYHLDTIERCKTVKPPLSSISLRSGRFDPEHGTLFVKTLAN